MPNACVAQRASSARLRTRSSPATVLSGRWMWPCWPAPAPPSVAMIRYTCTPSRGVTGEDRRDGDLVIRVGRQHHQRPGRAGSGALGKRGVRCGDIASTVRTARARTHMQASLEVLRSATLGPDGAYVRGDVTAFGARRKRPRAAWARHRSPSGHLGHSPNEIAAAAVGGRDGTRPRDVSRGSI